MSPDHMSLSTAIKYVMLPRGGVCLAAIDNRLGNVTHYSQNE